MALIRRFWQFLALSVAVTLALSVYADLGDLAAALAVFDWWLLPLVLALTVLNQALRFAKWEYLLGVVDVELPLASSVQVFGSGLIMVMTPGKLGEVWKAWLVREVDGTPLSRTMPVVAVERVTDFVGVALIAATGVIVFRLSPWILVALLGAMVAGLLVLQHEPTTHRLFALLGLVPYLGQYESALVSLYKDARPVLKPVPLAVTSFLSVVSWGAECIGMLLVLRGLGVDTTMLVAAFVFAFSSILGALSLLPGGVGVTEGSMTGLLVLFDVTRSTAVGATLIVRLATLWFVAAAALVLYSTFEVRHGDLIDRFFGEEQ